MNASPASTLIRALLTVSSLVTLLGPAIADHVGDDQGVTRERPTADEPAVRGEAGSRRELPDRPGAGSSAAEERTSRQNRRERREQRDTQPPAVPDGEAIIGTLEADASFDLAALPRRVRDTLPPTFVAAPSATGGQSGQGSPNGVLTAGPGCHLNCITSGIALARGVNAELQVTTTVPATIELFVHTAPEPWHSSAPNVTEFAVLLEDLEPGTTYEVVAQATDAKGKVSHAVGSFQTMRRNVTIHYNHATLFENVYERPLHAHPRVDGVWLESTWDIPSAGSHVALGLTKHQLSDVGRYLDFAFQLGQIHDHDTGACEPTQWHFPKEGHAGSDCTSVYNTVDMTLDVDARPPNAVSWTYHTYPVAPTSSIDAPSFQLPLTIEVLYTP